jgi:hypothetical protein
MKINYLFLAVVLAAVLCGDADAQWLKNGQPLDAAYAKTNGKFGAKVVFVDNNEQLFKDWEQPTAGVNIHEISKIVRKKSISSFIIFSNAAADKQGLANVTAKFIVINPLGAIVEESKNLEVWQNKPAPKERDLQLSADFLQVVLGDQSLLGIYTVHVVVHDKVADLSVELERKFELVAK